MCVAAAVMAKIKFMI